MKLIKEQPAGLGALLAAVTALMLMVYNVATGQGVFDEAVLTAGVAALVQLYTRYLVTPLADPKDSDGTPLTPAGT